MPSCAAAGSSGQKKGPPQRAVSRILFRLHPFGLRRTTIIPLAPSSLTGSSGLPGGIGRAVLIAPPYLALLRAGFCLPPVLPRARCALTAPFHPYPPSPARFRWAGFGAQAPTLFEHSGLEACRSEVRARRPADEGGRYIFCATSPSGCPDRALPGALPCGVRTFLPPSRPPGASARQALAMSFEHRGGLPRDFVRASWRTCRAEASEGREGGRSSGLLRRIQSINSIDQSSNRSFKK
jgi:hypothetical protein